MRRKRKYGTIYLFNDDICIIIIKTITATTLAIAITITMMRMLLEKKESGKYLQNAVYVCRYFLGRDRSIEILISNKIKKLKSDR